MKPTESQLEPKLRHYPVTKIHEKKRQGKSRQTEAKSPISQVFALVSNEKTRGIISIETKTVVVPDMEVWMTAGEIAELLHVRGISIESAIQKLKKDVISQNRYIARRGHYPVECPALKKMHEKIVAFMENRQSN